VSGNFITRDFFGTRPSEDPHLFLATNIVLEPLGDGAKALTAGLPVPGANVDFGNALRLDGSQDFVSTSQPTEAPQVFTLSSWFKSTATKEGYLIQFADQSVAPFGAADRRLYVDSAGAVHFYVSDTHGAHDIRSINGFNDGHWHHAAATLSPENG